MSSTTSHPLTAVGLARCRGHVRGRSVNGHICAQLQRELALVGAADGGDHPAGSPRLGQLDGEAADAARPGVHYHALPLLHVHALAQQQPRGGALHDQGECGHIVDAFGHVEGADRAAGTICRRPPASTGPRPGNTE
jgi:hypothetical protein